jgi:ABC-type uncharacterized transport system substrate-binding protein
MNRILKTTLIALAGLFITCGAASAHPHVWVKMKSAVVYGPDGSVVAVRHAWTFDDMYSVFATQGLEQKKKGEFTSEELQPLAKVNVESLKEYDFFTYARADSKDIAFVDPTEYRLEFDSKEKLLTLHFVLPLKASAKAKAFDLEVFDPSYFVDFGLVEKDPVSLEKAPRGCSFHIGKPQEMTKEMIDRLAAIPPGGNIPSDSYGAGFASKINVKCP